jgi:uncharacterized membrane protein
MITTGGSPGDPAPHGAGQDYAPGAYGAFGMLSASETSVAFGTHGEPEADRLGAADRAGTAYPAGTAHPAGRADWVPWLIALGVFAAYAAISLARYFQLAPGSWDLGIFTEYVRQLAHLRAPVVDIRGTGFNLLGDHFQPIVGLIAPVFLIFPSAATLLVVQALLTAVSVIPVSRAAAARLGTGAGRMIGAAYGLSWGLQQMIDFDFHEIAFAVPLLACSLSALLRGKVRAAALWALPLVFVKEDQGFTVAALGIVIVVMSLTRAGEGGPARRGQVPRSRALGDRARAGQYRSALGWGALLMVWGLAWSLVAITLIIPHFNPLHQYPYWTDGGVLSPRAAHLSAPSVLAQLGQSYVPKLRTTLLILLPVAFLALGSPLALVALPSLALRFVSTNAMYWGSGYHYNATVMPIVFIAAIDTLARIRAYRAQPGAAGTLPRRASWPDRVATRIVPGLMLVIAAALAAQFPLRNLWLPQTYQISAHVRGEDAAVARVPAGTTVEGTLTVLAPLAARDDPYWIGNPGNPAPRYIVFDELDSGWNPLPSNPLTFVDQRHPGATYRQIYVNNFVYVFRRVGG